MGRKSTKEIDKAEIEDAKNYTEEQLKRRKFCRSCLKHKGRRQFSSNEKVCRLCHKKKRKKKEFRDKLLAHEIYVPGANQIVIDKVVGGRGLVSKLSLAKFLGVHERTVIRLKNKGELTGYDFLGQTYFKKEEIEAWLEKKLGEKIELDNKYVS